MVTVMVKLMANNVNQAMNRSILTTQFCRIKGCDGAGCPQPISFEKFKLPQQIIYCRKGNLSESPKNRLYIWNVQITHLKMIHVLRV